MTYIKSFNLFPSLSHAPRAISALLQQALLAALV